MSIFDHAKACKEVLKAGIDIYASKGTAEALKISSHRLHLFKHKNLVYEDVKINNLLIKPFQAVHDVNEPVSFYIRDYITNESLVFITDSAYVKYKIPDVDVLMIECNYNKKIIDNNVKNERLNINLRNRIVKSHMSLKTCLEAIKFMDKSKLKKIYVMHLSNANSDENIILDEIRKVAGVNVEICRSS